MRAAVGVAWLFRTDSARWPVPRVCAEANSLCRKVHTCANSVVRVPQHTYATPAPTWQESCTEVNVNTAPEHPPSHILLPNILHEPCTTSIPMLLPHAAPPPTRVLTSFAQPCSSLSLTSTGTSVSYLDTVHHRASMEGLTPGTRYFYRCGNPSPHPADGDDPTGAMTATSTGTGLPSVDVTLVGEGVEERGENRFLSIRSKNEGGSEDAAAGEVGLGLESEGPSSSVTTPGVRGARGGGGGATELGKAGEWSSVLSFVTAPEVDRWVARAWLLGKVSGLVIDLFMGAKARAWR